MLCISLHLQAMVVVLGWVVHAVMRARASHNDIGRAVCSKAVEQGPVVVLIHEVLPVIRDAHIAASSRMNGVRISRQLSHEPKHYVIGAMFLTGYLDRLLRLSVQGCHCRHTCPNGT